MSNKLDLYQVLEEEYKSLHANGELPEDYLETKKSIQQEQLKQDDLNQALVAEMYKIIHREQPSAFCLSGGGIRSATFGLGVLQGLARHNLLGRFDYLSTVSGGGYIGSWLTAWIHRENPQVVIEALEQGQPQCALKPEPEQIRYLRDYSNYMTPKLGLFSADGWTLVATYLRNLILNWLMFIPLFFVVLCLPRISVAVVQLKPDSWLLWLTLGLGFLLATVAIAYICLNLPSARKSTGATAEFTDRRDHQSSFLWACLFPLGLAAVLLTTYWAWFRNIGGELENTFMPFLLFGSLLHFLGWAPYVFKVKTWSWKLLLEAFGIIVIGAFGGFVAWIVATKFFLNPQANAEYYGSFAMPVLLLVYLLAGILYVGITSRSTTDEDREWWGRSSAWILLVLLGWASLSSLVVFGPFGLIKLPPLLSTTGGVVSGIVTLFLGFSSKTPANKREEERAGWPATAKKWALGAAVPIFVLFLVVIFSLASSLLIKLVADWLYEIDWSPLGSSLPRDPSGHLHIIHNAPGRLLIELCLVMIALSFTASSFVNINKFSLHAIYRNRLIRAYLGASNKNRKPNPFTGFDPDDNVAMSLLRQQKPLHVLNMALNLVGGEKLAWQERKAESFTVTPLHCGSWNLGYRKAEDYGKNRALDRAITLGTAMAISGAAASPNMGYHSSPAVTFLLAMFNIRLGWWLGNPGKAGERTLKTFIAGDQEMSTFNLSGPRLAVRPLFEEAFGLTNAENPYVYLSDGGHFENLGLYEMILRRCHFVLVSDAGQDPDCAFEDLGNAIRKIRIDFGIRIEPTCFKNILPRGEKEVGNYCAMGKIFYSDVDPDAPDGVLIYLKPVLSGTEPVDVYNYSQVSREFPHESTVDQWFSESQFESYRMLGLHIMEQICGDWVAPPTGDAFGLFQTQVQQYLARVKA